MRKVICLLIMMLNSSVYSQNLVLNYSFELHDTCPNNGQQLTYAIPWFQPNTSSSSSGSTEYFNECDTFIVDVPSNFGGYQKARTGVAYAGFSPYFGNFNTNGSEYLEGTLSSSLVAGKKYCVQFYVSLANRAVYAIDEIGAYLSADAVFYSNPNWDKILPYQPQIENVKGNVIKDTANWVLISGEYIAQGGEKFITIGNFYTNTGLTIDTVNADTSVTTFFPMYAAYYYIDDVSVTLCEIEDNTTSHLAAPNAFSPNGDGQNDVFRANGKNILSFEMSIYNRWGEKVFECNDINTGWDGTYSGNSAQVGVYIYVINATGNDGKKYDLKGNLSLLR